MSAMPNSFYQNFRHTGAWNFIELEKFKYRNRGLVFRRFLEQAVITKPVTETDITHGYDWKISVKLGEVELTDRPLSQINI